MDIRDELRQIRERAEAATEGPWRVLGTGWQDFFMVGNDDPEEGVAARAAERPDAEFIAHARTDVPRLVAALEAVVELADHWDRLADLDGEKDVAGWRMKVKARAVRKAVTEALEQP